MKGFLLIITAFIISSSSFGQGCSDAGLCSVGMLNIIQFKFKQLPSESTTLVPLMVEDTDLILDGRDTIKSKIKSQSGTTATTPASDSTKQISAYTEVSYYTPLTKYFIQFVTQYGLGEQSTSVLTNQLEGNFRLIKSKLFGQIKVPYTFVSGKLGSTQGLSDVTLSLSLITLNHGSHNITLTGGIKLPTNKADLSNNDIPLPMVYQTSLGSTDALFGLRYLYKKWDFTVGYQHSFNANENRYLHTNTLSHVNFYNSYFESNQMKRAADLVFRVVRNFTAKKINFNPGVLLIYHLDNDIITNGIGERVEVAGSKGPTINLNLAGIIPVTERFDFTFTLAKPVVVREHPTDGLQRVFVMNAGIRFSRF